MRFATSPSWTISTIISRKINLFCSCTPEVGTLAKGCLIRPKDMNVRVRIAVMSHLSDAQAMLDFGLQKEANAEINLAKAILLAHPNTDDWATENELNEIATKIK